MPKKPSQPLYHVAFPKAGPVSRVLEPLPPAKDDLETAIVTKFVDAIRVRFQRHLEIPKKGPEWPDFLTMEQGARIGIEVVEVVNHEHIALGQARQRYVERMNEELSDLLYRLPGLLLEIEDGYQAPPYPPASGGSASGIVSRYRSLLESRYADLIRLSPRQFFSIRGPSGPQGEIIGLVARRPTSDSTVPAVITFTSSFPVAVDRAHQLLAETIRAKVNKRYQAPRDAEWSLWLLAYDVNGALAGDHDIAAYEANLYLRTVKHPFSEIWLIWPTAGEVPSFLESVWPSTDSTSTERR